MGGGEPPPPVYIGFGSIAFDGMERVQKAVYEAVRQNGVRAIMSSGWMQWQTGNGDDSFAYPPFRIICELQEGQTV